MYRIHCLAWFSLMVLFLAPNQAGAGDEALPQSENEVAAFRIVGAPEWVPGTGWRIRFESIAGRHYRLQRSTDLNDWNTVGAVGTLEANSSLTSVIDPTGRDEPFLFWRVQRMEGDAVAGETPFAEAFRITSLDLLEDGETWRVTWNSREGGLYLLQRSFDLIDWDDVAIVPAFDASTFADDPDAVGEPRAFWRVVLLDGDDIIGGTPIVDNLEAYLIQSEDGVLVELRASTLDNVEVMRLAFMEGPSAQETTVSLGDADAPAPRQWVLTAGAPDDALAVRYYRARAFDAANNIGELTRGFTLFDPMRYAPIGADGEPRRGAAVAIREDGTLGAFEYRPGGGDPSGGGDVAFRFPAGATLTDAPEGPRFSFPEASVAFELGGPLQFAEELVLEGDLFDLPTEGVTVNDLARLAGRFPQDGLPVRLFDRFDLNWLAGTLTPNGIEGGVFSLSGEDLPLPETSALYADFMLDLSHPEFLRLPFHGTFALADGTDHPLTLTVSPERPVWLELRANGGIALSGTGTAVLPGGGSFRASLRINDPTYEIRLSVDSAEIPFLGSLADALPDAADVCLNASNTHLAIDCLRRHARAYAAFSAGAGAAAPAAGDDPAPSAPPRAIDTVEALAGAWTASLGSGLSGSLPAEAVRDFVRSAGESAASSRDLGTVAAYYRALEEARATLLKAGDSGDINAVLPDLEDALDQARAAALLRAGEADAIRNLDTMKETLEILLEAAGHRQLAGIDDGLDQELEDALARVLRRFLYEHIGALGVTPDAYSPDAGSRIASMNRFTVFRHLRDLAEVSGLAMLLGYEAESGNLNFFGAPVDEALAQLAIRSALRTDQDLAEAHSARDYLGYLLALADRLDLVELRQMGFLPGVAEVNAVIPEFVDWDTYESVLLELAVAHDSIPRPSGWSAPLAAEMKTLLRILDEVPDSLAFPAPPLERAAARVESVFDELFASSLGGLPVSFLLTVLETGNRRADLARRISGIPASDTWENERLPALVLALRERAVENNDWTTLEKTVESLLRAADRDSVSGTAEQAAYLTEAADVLAAAREVAVAIWNDTASRRDPLLEGIDLLLPGDLEIRNAAGSLRYHRLDRELSGAFRGELGLPGFLGGLHLTVARAAFSSGGLFELVAHGTVSLPGAPPPLALSVEPGDPAVFRFRPGQPLELSGTAEFLLANGMAFAGSADLRDPLYRFRLEARDLHFDTGVSVLDTFWPAAPDFNAFDLDRLESWTDLFGGVFTLGEDSGLLAPPTETAIPGETPDIRSPAIDRVSAAAFWHSLYREADAGGDTEARAILTDRYLEMLALALQRLERATENLPAINATDAGVPLALGDAFDAAPAASAATPTRLLNFDFSPGPETGFDQEKTQFTSGFGPAHDSDDSMLSALGQDRWNVVIGSTTSGFVFADGTAADGVSVEFGHGRNLWGEIDWDLEPTFLLRDPDVDGSTPLPPFPDFGSPDPRLLADIASGFSFEAGRIQRGPLGIRVGGLPSGYYRVYAIAADPTLAIQTWIGTGQEVVTGNASSAGLMLPVLNSNQLSQWTRGLTYRYADVTLGEDQFVWLATERRFPDDPQDTTKRAPGELAGLQIVAIDRPLVVERFASSPGSVQAGDTAILSWNVPGATTVLIHPEPAGAPAVFPSAGTIKVNPEETTVYELTATDLIQTAGATLTVETFPKLAEEDKKAIEDGIEGIENIGSIPFPDDIGDDPEKLEKVIEKLDRAARKVEELLDHPAVHDDPELFRRLVRAGLGIAGKGALAGSEGDSANLPAAMGPASDKATRRQDEKEGLDPDAGEPKRELIRFEFSAEESFRVLRDHLERHADGALLGGERTVSLALIEAHMDNLFEKLMLQYGYTPETPVLSPSLMRAAGERDLAKSAHMLAATIPGLVGVLEDLGFPPEPFDSLAKGLHEALVSARQEGRHRTWRERLAALRSTGDANSLFGVAATFGGTPPGDLDTYGGNAFVRQYSLSVLRDIARSASDDQPPLDEELLAMETTINFVLHGSDGFPHAEAAEFFQKRLVSFLGGLKATFNGPDPAWTAENLDRWLDELARIEKLRLRYAPIVPPAPALGEAPLPGQLLREGLIPALKSYLQTLESPEVHRERNRIASRLVRAAGELGVALEDISLDADPQATPLSAQPLANGSDDLLEALRLETGALLQETHTGATALRNDLLAVQEEDRPSGLSLALGNLKVSRVFGELFFNRITGDFSGSFGGRMRFTGIDAVFEIEEAAIASDGSYSFSGNTAFPLGGPGLRIESGIQASGTTSGDLTASGTGQLTVGTGTGEQTYAADLAYDSVARSLAFSATADDAVFSFGEDFVFIPQTLSAAFQAGASPSGALAFSGSAGLFATGTPSGTPQAADYLLFIDNLGAGFLFQEDAFAASLESGTLHLPEFVGAGDCPSGEGGPSVALNPENPLIFAYEHITGDFLFTGEIGFRNLGFTLPGFEDVDDGLLEIDICEADLVFPEDVAPALRIPGEAPASLTVNLPHTSFALTVGDVDWPLDGLPSAVITLQDNVPLFGDEESVQLSLLGVGSGGCPESSVILGEENGLPYVVLSGGMEIAIPAGILSSANGADPVRLSGCGSLELNPGLPPLFTVDQLSASGEFVLGGSNGVRLSASSLTVENTEALFDDGAPEPFRIRVQGGRMTFPNGAYFTVIDGTIASDGTYDIEVEAAGGAGGIGGFDVSGGASASLDATGAFAFSGNATLTFPDGAPEFAAAIAYDSNAQELSFSAAGTELQVIDFGSEFALFQAGFSFTIAGMDDADTYTGEIVFGGESGVAAGLFRRPEAAVTPSAALTPEDFLLTVDGASLAVAFAPNEVHLALAGTLSLPADAFAPGDCCGTEAGSPTVGIDSENPITLSLIGGEASFGGTLFFEDFCFCLPDMPDFVVQIDTARLTFDGAAPPLLEDLNGQMTFPLPQAGEDETRVVALGIQDGAWAMDGFPTGTIALMSDVELFNSDGFTFSALSASTDGCPLGTSFSVSRIESGPNAGTPRFALNGAVRFAIPADILLDETGGGEPGQVFAVACGGLALEAGQWPEFSFDALTIGADSTFRLGGEDGLLVENASLQLLNLNGLFDPEVSTFELVLNGALRIEDVGGLALQNARFRFPHGEFPRFSLQGISVQADAALELIPGLPLQITEMGFEFFDDQLPIVPPTPNDPFLFHPDNLKLTMSAGVFIPSPDAAFVSGRVDNLELQLENGIPRVELSGFGFGVEELSIPPLELAGQVYVGNLDDLDNIFFAGEVGGKLNGAGVVALLAFRLDGLIGVCFDVNAGPAGIPLGPTGFLFTGASGGVTFANTFTDPCDFSSYIRLGDDGRPQDTDFEPAMAPLALTDSGEFTSNGNVLPVMMTWEELGEYQQRAAREQEADRLLREHRRNLTTGTVPLASDTNFVASDTNFVASDTNFVASDTNFVASGLRPMTDHPARPDATDAVASGLYPMSAVPLQEPEFPCPTADCPPATVNIFCQPHPDTELFPDHVIVKFTSLDEAFLNSIGLSRQEFANLGLTTASEIAARVSGDVRDAVEPLVPPVPDALWDLNPDLAAELTFAILDGLDQMEIILFQIVQSAVQGVLGDNDEVYDALLEVAYAGVPCPDATVKISGTFSHATVSSVLSGTGGGILSTTGSAGLVGSINLLGLPVGTVDGFISVTDAMGDPNPSVCGDVRVAIGPLEMGEIRALYECPQCVTGMLESFGTFIGCIGNEVFTSVLTKVAPELADLPPADAVDLMTDEEKVAFMAQLFSDPGADPANLMTCVLALLEESFDAFQPSFTLCGQAQPKIFGIALGEPSMEMNIAAQRDADDGTFTLAGRFAYSPTQLLLYTVGLSILPPLDQAEFGFGLGFPDPAAFVLGGVRGDFASVDNLTDLLADGFDHFLQNATMTTGMQINPFGLKMASLQSRVVMPNLLEHPARPGYTYVRPENREPPLPHRADVMMQAVRQGVLANPLWKGDAEDLHTIYPDGSPERTQLEGKSFAVDYFPHGGILAAGDLLLPRALVDAPPDFLPQIFSEDTGFLDRLGFAADYIGDYLLATSEVGNLSLYVPAPNPPMFNDGAGNPLTPRQLMDAIMSVDPSAVGMQAFYPAEQFFFMGEVESRLLGVPIADASVLAIPPDPDVGGDGIFRILAGIPEESWLESFIESAGLAFEIRQTPLRPIEDRFLEWQQQVNFLIDSGADEEAVNQFADAFAASLFDDLPKASLQVQVDNFRVPDALSDLLTAGTSAQLVAYSPFFEPDFPGFGPIAEARRMGGIAVQGQFGFSFQGHELVNIENAELGIFPRTTGLPALAGLLEAPLITLPGNVAMRDVLFEFHSDPAVGENFFAASGELDPIALGSLMQITPLDGGDRLGAAFRATRGATTPSAELSVQPALVALPVFGDDLQVLIHGETELDPFTFSTDSEWAATVSLSGGLVLRDLTGTPVMQVGDASHSFKAALTGTGLASASLTLDIPLGMPVTAFPGAPNERLIHFGAVDGASAQLTVGSDGAFTLAGTLDGALELPGMPVESLHAGAEVELNESSLFLTGTVSGGTLGTVNVATGTATLIVTPDTISLTGSATVPPIQLGNFRIAALDGGNLGAELDETSFGIPSGARLAIDGVSNDLLVLDAFEVQNNGDFSVAVTSGNVQVGNHFRLTEGTASFNRLNNVSRLALTAPRLTVFPGTEFATLLPTPLEQLLIESNGRFYYDSGQQELALPHTFSASGRLEFGWEPDADAPHLAVNTTPISFGQVDTGSSVTRTLQISNTGGSQLMVGASVSDNTAFRVDPILSTLAPGETRELQVRFTPNAGDDFSEILTLTHNTITSPTTIGLAGEGRAVPLYYQSADAIAFGDQPVGGGALRTLFVSNLGKAPLEVSDVALDGPFETNTAPFTLAPGDSRYFFITFRPDETGGVSGSLTLTANDDDGPHTVTLSGSGSQQRWHVQRDIGGHLRSLALRNSFTGIAVGENGTLLTTANAAAGGVGWTRRPVAGGVALEDVTLYQGLSFRVWAVGQAGVVVTTNDGNLAQWTPIAHPTVSFAGNYYMGASPWQPNRVMLVGQKGGNQSLIIQQTGDNTFEETLPGTPHRLNAVSALFQFDQTVLPAGSTMAVAVGDQRTIYRTGNGGGNWSLITPPGEVPLGVTFHAVELHTSGVGLIVGDAGVILRSTDFGQNWTKLDVPAAGFSHLYDVRMEGDNAWISGQQGLVLRSTDAGLTWAAEGTVAANRNLYAINLIDGLVWSAGANGFIQHRPEDPPAGPLISLSTGYLDFGTVAIGATKTRGITVSNPGTDTLEVTSIQGGSLFTPNRTSLTVPPGQSRNLSVVFHPTGEVDIDPNQPNGIISFQNNSALGTQYMQMRGVAKPNAWRQIASGTDRHLTRVQFVSATTGYAIYNDGVIKTTDGGETWTDLPNVDPPGTVRSLFFINANTGMVGGGDGSSAFVRRTTNGGSTWSNATVTSAGAPIQDISFAPGQTSRGYAVSGAAGQTGNVLTTTNGGSSWAPTSSQPPGSFSGGAVYSYQESRLYASSSGNLYRTRNFGSSWETIFQAGGVFPIQAIRTVGLFNGYAGGIGGFFRRTSNADGVPTQWDGVPAFTAGAIQDIHFVTQDRGWLTVGGAGSGGTSSIYRTENGGVTWKEDFAATSGNIRSVWGVGTSGNLAYAAGTGGRVWKYEPHAETPAGLVSMPPSVFAGETGPGEILTGQVTIRNIGAANVRIERMSLDNGGNEEAFKLRGDISTTLAPGESVDAQFLLRAETPGTHTATLTVISDGAQRATETEISARVVAPPQVVIIDSEPSGLSVMIAGVSRVTPVAYSVSSDGGPGDWTPGSTHSVVIAEEQTRDGVSYRFQQWEPAREREFTLTASATRSKHFVARHVVGSSDGASPQGLAASPLSAAPASVDPPSDVPAGPWLRLTEAAFAVPALGEIGVQGTVFLSPDQITASLDSRAFRIPSDSNLPELLNVSAGSWRFDYNRIGAAAFLTLRAQSPGIDLMANPYVPPSQLVFNFESNGHFQGSFATHGTTPVIPGVFELGPGNVELSRDPFFSLHIDGQVRLLRHPNGGWTVDEPLSFSAAEGPFEHAFTNLPSPLLNLGFLSLTPEASAELRVARDTNGVFSLSARDLRLDLLGRSFASLAGGVDSAGLLTLHAGPPAAPFTIGPMRYEVSEDTEIAWNVLDGDLNVTLPPGSLKASGVTGWPSDGVDFPGFTFDSGGDFERKVNLPTFTFNGIDIDGGGSLSDNYLLLRRQSGVTSVRVRDERSFFGNELKLALDVANNGQASGSFVGTFGIQTFVFGFLEFGTIAMLYDDSEPDYQFRGRFPLIGTNFGIFFGSAGGKFSHLSCDGPSLDDCEENWSLFDN